MNKTLVSIDERKKKEYMSRRLYTNKIHITTENLFLNTKKKMMQVKLIIEYTDTE